MHILDDIGLNKNKKYWIYLLYNHALYFKKSENKLSEFNKFNLIYSVILFFLLLFLDLTASYYSYKGIFFRFHIPDIIFNNCKYYIIVIIYTYLLYHLIPFFTDYFSQNFISIGSILEYKTIFIRILPALITFYFFFRLFFVFASIFYVNKDITYFQISKIVKYIVYFMFFYSFLLFTNGVKFINQSSFVWTFVLAFLSVSFSLLITFIFWIFPIWDFFIFYS